MENFKVSNSWLMFIFGRLSRTLDPKVNYVLWSLGIRACIVSENEITEQWLKSWLLQKQVALGTLLCGLEISYIWKYEHFIHRHWGVSVIFVFLFWKLNMQRGQGLLHNTERHQRRCQVWGIHIPPNSPGTCTQPHPFWHASDPPGKNWTVVDGTSTSPVNQGPVGIELCS